MRLKLAGFFGAGLALLIGGLLFTVVALPALASAASHTAAAPSPGSAKSARAAACSTFSASFANHLGKTQAQVDAAAAAAVADALKQAVKNGKLTSAQADAIKARIPAGADVCAMLAHLHGPAAFGRGPGGGFGKLKDVMDGYLRAAAGALGITPAELKADYAAGKTLHQLADAKGLSEAQFKIAFTAQAKSLLDAAVTAGKLTSTQEQMMLDRLAAAPHLPGWDVAPKHP